MTPPIMPQVPHAGAMRLLDRVIAHDADRILCAAMSHRDPANPLRRDGMLPAVCGVEYALQAMAAHGALTGDGAAQPPGYLASLRGVSLQVARLDDVAAELRVEARALSRAARGFVYEFRVLAGDVPLISGQAAIIIPENP
ncbi:phosphotransferase [Roseomonas sp. SSH11]|uniref:Phosphotransferase n=1 Tax=Pararoseomonas baculiformis TaxID=2820812 RepID=A0ABS4ACV3_9PROT|nr:phosphotransferase [Pararoseomonas baculiformis]MBP0444796.1 phosphotransferase [Pararoseomonas baculiformis]